MREQIFEKIIDKFDELKLEAYSYADTEKVRIAKFKVGTTNKNFKQVGEVLKKHNWKATDELKKELMVLRQDGMQFWDLWENYTNEYVDVIYDKFYDRVSVRRVTAGYKMSERRKRYYPFKTKTPRLCLSKHLYTFTQTVKNKSPRIFKSFSVYSLTKHEQVALKIMLDTQCDIDNLPNVNYKHIVGSKNVKEIFKKTYGIDVPKSVLKTYKPDDINYVLQVLENPNEITKFAMYLATLPKNKEMNFLYYHSSLIFQHLCEMKNLGDYGWLLRDYFGDLHHFKLKTNLLFTNVDRIRELHSRYTRMRILEGVPEIKVHKRFVDLVNSFNMNCDIIDTKDKLIEEGSTMEHCVATYHGQINAGQCCIVHIPYEDTPGYTLQITGGIEGQAFSIGQFKGKFNCEAPQELKDKINNMIANYIMSGLREYFQKVESEMELPVIN